jgi:hypothetical protein
VYVRKRVFFIVFSIKFEVANLLILFDKVRAKQSLKFQTFSENMYCRFIISILGAISCYSLYSQNYG